MTKNRLGKKGFISAYTLRSQSIFKESQGRNRSRKHGQKLFPDFSLIHAQLASLYNPKPPTYSGDGAMHSGLDPTSINSQETSPEICPQVKLMVGIFQLRFSLPRGFEVVSSCQWKANQDTVSLIQ